MARREFARIGTDMPDEPSVRACTVEELFLYDHALYLRKEMSRCGVVPFRPAVWAELATNATETKCRRWLKGLEKRRMVVVDERYSEVLLRTFVRHDGLLGQPNVVAAMVADFQLIHSPKLRTAFLVEMRRLWDLELSPGPRGGWLLAMGHYPQAKGGRDDHRVWPDVIDAASLARLRKAIGPGLAHQIREAIANGEVEPFTEGSPGGIPEGFGQTLPHTPSRGRDRGERLLPTTSDERRATSAASGTPDRTPPALPGGEHAHPNPVDALLDQTGPYVPKVRTELAAELQPLVAAGIPTQVLTAALHVWRTRRAGPKLLPHLVQDQLTPDQQQDPRFAGLLADARTSA